ncbi:MAG: hypothetical protein KJZ62_01155 [Fimbriimonadaceae bacterium]|nr:hypothetical protein [Fimbriimonadaceae bacterium]QOJ11428.1 MAG: hypothetical protein HRU74_04950 [Chthonomonadaceae bacterium]
MPSITIAGKSIGFSRGSYSAPYAGSGVDAHTFENCTFDEGFDLSGRALDAPLKLENCVCKGAMNLSGLTIRARGSSGDFKLENPNTTVLNLSATKIEGELDMRGIWVEGAIRGIGLEVGAGLRAGPIKEEAGHDLGISDALLINLMSAERNLQQDSYKRNSIAGLIDLTDLRCKGTVNLSCVQVVKDLRLVNAVIEGTLRFAQWVSDSELQALSGQNAKLSAALKKLPAHAFVGGMLDLHGVQVESDVYLQGTLVAGRTIFSNSTIGQTLIARPWFPNDRGDPKVLRQPDLKEALENAEGEPTELRGGIRAARCTIKGLLDLSGAFLGDGVDLDFSEIGSLYGHRSGKCNRTPAGRRKPSWRNTVPAISEYARHAVEIIRICESATNKELELISQPTHLKSKRFQFLAEGSGAFDDLERNSKDDSELLRNLLHEFSNTVLKRGPNNSGVKSRTNGLKFLNPLAALYKEWPVHTKSRPTKFDCTCRLDLEDWTQSVADKDSHSFLHISGKLSLRSVTIRGDLSLQGALISEGLDVSAAVIEGNLICRATNVAEGKAVSDATCKKDLSDLFPTVIGPHPKSRDMAASITGENLQVGRYVSLSGAILTNGVNLYGAKVQGMVSADSWGGCRTMIGAASGPEGRSYSLRLTATTIGGSVNLIGAYLAAGLSLENASVKGDLSANSYWFDHDRTGLPYLLKSCYYSLYGTDERRAFIGQGYWSKGEKASLLLNGLQIEGDVDLRGLFALGGILCQSAKLGGSLMLEGIERPEPASSDAASESKLIATKQYKDETYFTTFIGPAVETGKSVYSVDLTGTQMDGDIDLRGSILTSGLRFSNATIGGHIVLQPHLMNAADASHATLIYERTLIGPCTGMGMSRSTKDHEYKLRVSVMGTGSEVHGYLFAGGCHLTHGIIMARTKIEGQADFSPFKIALGQSLSGRQESNEKDLRSLIGIGVGPKGAWTGIRAVGASFAGDLFLQGICFRPPSKATQGNSSAPLIEMAGATVGSRLVIDEVPEIPSTLRPAEGQVALNFASLRARAIEFHTGVSESPCETGQQAQQNQKPEDNDSTEEQRRVQKSKGCEFAGNFFFSAAVCLLALSPLLFTLFWEWDRMSVIATYVAIGVLVVAARGCVRRASSLCMGQGSLLGRAYSFRDVRVDSVSIGQKDRERLSGEVFGGQSRPLSRGQSLFAHSVGVGWAMVWLTTHLAFGPWYGVSVAFVGGLTYLASFASTSSHYWTRIKKAWGSDRAVQWAWVSFAFFLALAVLAHRLGVYVGFLGVLIAFTLLVATAWIVRRRGIHDYIQVLALAENDEGIFATVERQFRAEGNHSDADKVSLQWQRLQFLRSPHSFRWLPSLLLHMLTGHGVRTSPLVGLLAILTIWGTALFQSEGAVIELKPKGAVARTQLSSVGDAFYLTMGYFWPISNAQVRTQWAASDMPIRFPEIKNDEATGNTLRPTYSQVASALSLIGWIWAALVVQNLLKFIPRLKERKG